MVGKSADDSDSIESAVDRLDPLEARRLLVAASQGHDDVLRAARTMGKSDYGEYLAEIVREIAEGV